MSKALFLAPRILSLLFVGFLSLFALDVFSEYQGIDVIIPLLMHLIPSIILLILSIIAWKRELVGVIIFALFAVWYVLSAGFDKPWVWYLVIAGPALLMSVLYFVSWKSIKS